MSLILTGLLLPALVIFAALGVGGSIVRATADETQRASELSALAAAVNLPNVGRPDIQGDPRVTPSFPASLPPAASHPPLDPCHTVGSVGSSSYGASSAYYQISQAQDCVDRRVSRQLGVGPISSFDDLFGTWHQGCDLAEAQYARGRARMARNFALVSGGSPKTPVCPDASGSFPANHPERVYIRPEMESTGAYELQKCLVNGGNCFNSVTTTASSELRSIGQKFTDKMAAVAGRGNATDAASCLVNPSGTGCALSHDELKKTLLSDGVPNGKAERIANTVSRAMPSQISALAGPAYAKAATGVNSSGAYDAIPVATGPIESIMASVFATTAPNVCSVPLGPTSGQTLCGTGVNLASLLPSTLSPRVRSIITHSIEIPLVPNWGNSGEEGDLTFTEQALARRTFKNAVVVPTIPKQLSVPTATGLSACYTGGVAANTVAASGVTWTLGSLSGALGPVGAGTGATTDTCGNAELDNTVADSNLCLNGSLVATEAQRHAACKVSNKLAGVIDAVNNLPATSQHDMIDAASTVNAKANDAANTVIADQLKAEDPSGTYDPADCRTTNASGQSQTPAAWCVNVAGQQIKDLQDFYGSPPDGTGPTFNDVLASAASSNEPLAVMGLSSTIDLCDRAVAGGSSQNLCAAINSALAASLGRALTPAETVTSLPMVIPALDVVPVLVHADPSAPGGYTFELDQNTTSTPGLYRAVLLDPDEAYPLCPAGTGDRRTCIGQSTVITVTPPVTVPPITLPVTLPPTTLPPSTLPPTTLPPTTLPPTTVPPTTVPPTTVPPTTIKFP